MVKRMLHTGKGRAVALDFLTAHGGLLVCGLFLMVGVLLAGDYGIGDDEWFQRDTAAANLNYILGQADGVATAVPHERFYGVVLELPLLLAERVVGLEDYYYIHRLRLTVTHLFFLAGGFFCCLLAWRLFNNRLIALFALLLFLLHPRIYAHSFINPKDLPFLSAFVIALYLMERAFRKDTLGAFLLLGIAVGIATNLRIMGLMLFLAVIGLRAWDVGLARSWGERRGIVVSGGLFVAAAGLTIYILSPNAWGDPLAYLTGVLSLTTDHPTVVPLLFQGELFSSDDLPWHYALTWFLITTPPAALLLGIVGLAALLVRGVTRPGAVFRNTRLRFGGLLLACFGLPLVAVALLDANIPSAGKHLYFSYVPFALLAAGGLHWLAGSWPRAKRWRVGIYGLFVLGLGLILLQMAQLHPWQHFYFNFLVDRSGPGEPKAQYELTNWDMAAYAVVQYLLRERPGEQLEANVASDFVAFLPPAGERRRLRVNSPVHDPEYALEAMRRWFDAAHRPDLAFNSQYFSVYNSAIWSLRALDGSRMDGDAVAGYERLYQEAVAGEPIIQGEYGVYRTGRRLTFVKEDCQPGERAGEFGVKVDRGSARPGRIPELYLYSSNFGVRVGDKCLAVTSLPDRPVAHLVAGQYGGGSNPRAIWEAAYSFSSPGLGEMMAELGSNRAGITAGAGFELYRQEGEIIYYREGCQGRDAAPRFFLHTTPEDAGDLPPERRGYGFEARDFYFGQQGGARFDGQCLATIGLPDYPIAEVRTGQEGYWEFRGLPPVASGVLREWAAALSGVAADFRGEFDLYWRDGELIYRREGCTAGDTAAGFFLHITPVDGGDLALERREYGFESRDFAFERWGGRSDGSCLAAAPLPGYAIAGVRTGQYAAGQGEVWSAELGPP